MSTFDHFAYGSNLSTRRLRARCPGATPLAKGFVRGRQLRFHKIGRDGTGKADAFWTGLESDLVWGLIYRCPLEEKAVLDRCESVGIGYEEVLVQVHTSEGVRETFLYAALQDCIDPTMQPADWYLRHVVRGAIEHGIPDAYWRMICNATRTKRNIRLH